MEIIFQEQNFQNFKFPCFFFNNILYFLQHRLQSNVSKLNLSWVLNTFESDLVVWSVFDLIFEGA